MSNFFQKYLKKYIVLKIRGPFDRSYPSLLFAVVVAGAYPLSAVPRATRTAAATEKKRRRGGRGAFQTAAAVVRFFKGENDRRTEIVKGTINVTVKRSKIPDIPPPGELIAEVENREERCLEAEAKAASLPSGGETIPQNDELMSLFTILSNLISFMSLFFIRIMIWVD